MGSGSTKFSPIQFIDDIGKELIASFTQSGQASSPGEVGYGREASLRDKLQRVFGETLFLKHGFVFDSHGEVSLQQDVVINERQFGLSFSLGSVDGPTYFPCETVIAAGEVKSKLTKKELTNSFAKCISVKSLRRKLLTEILGNEYEGEFGRKYGSATSLGLLGPDAFDQIRHSQDQVFYFCVSQVCSVSDKVLFEAFRDSCALENRKAPDLLVTLDGTVVTFALRDSEGSPQICSQDCATSVNIMRNVRNPFSVLVSGIRNHIANGRTVPWESLGVYFNPRSNAVGTNYSFDEPFDK